MWFKNLQPQRTQISTVANASFIQNSNWMTSSVDCNYKFSELTFSTLAISKATSKLFSSQGCSDDKNCLYLAAFSSRFVDFAVQFCFHCKFSFHKERSTMAWFSWTNQNSFATHRDQWDLYRLVCHFFVLTKFWCHLWSITDQTHGNMESLYELFFVKKYLLVGAPGVCYERVNGRVNEWEMYVFHTNQIGSTVNNQSNFLFLLQVHATWYFC